MARHSAWRDGRDGGGGHSGGGNGDGSSGGGEGGGDGGGGEATRARATLETMTNVENAPSNRLALGCEGGSASPVAGRKGAGQENSATERVGRMNDLGGARADQR